MLWPPQFSFNWGTATAFLPWLSSPESYNDDQWRTVKFNCDCQNGTRCRRICVALESAPSNTLTVNVDQPHHFGRISPEVFKSVRHNFKVWYYLVWMFSLAWRSNLVVWLINYFVLPFQYAKDMWIYGTRWNLSSFVVSRAEHSQGAMQLSRNILYYSSDREYRCNFFVSFVFWFLSRFDWCFLFVPGHIQSLSNMESSVHFTRKRRHVTTLSRVCELCL